MEFPDLGRRCSVQICKQLDFLPFSCASCNKVFCLDHREKGAHNCQSHSNVENVRHPLELESYTCSLNECEAIELVPVQCPECNKNFCMRHRHQQDHNCEKYESKSVQEVTPKEKVEAIIAILAIFDLTFNQMKGRELKVTVKEPKAGKNSKTAAKVALMKLKLHAVGDKGIPQAEREYFNVVMPSFDANEKQDTIPVYFSKIWTIGKIIDYIAELRGIPNKNNIAGEKKLQLRNTEDMVIDPSETLENTFSNKIIDRNVRTLKLSYSCQS